jgi:hypothetical protein
MCAPTCKAGQPTRYDREILAKTNKGDVSTIRKGIAEFARLLAIPGRK